MKLLSLMIISSTLTLSAQDRPDAEPRAIPVQQVTWKQLDVTPNVAQLYLYKLYISEESGKQSIVNLVNTLCGPDGCSTALPSTAYPAIVTGNVSQLSATNPQTNLESTLSPPFTGDQGCIFRNNLYAVGARVLATVSGDQQALLNEFQAAKFKLIQTIKTPKGTAIREECVGYLVQ